MIILALFKAKAYPINENVLYEMIYEHHRHQKEDLLNKNKAEHEQTKKTRRKHANYRRSELQMFLRDYLDVLFYQQIIDKRRRKRVFDDSRYAPGEDTAPLNTPWWTKSGYNRSMLSIVTRAVENYKDNIDNPVNTRHHSSRKKSRSTEEAEDAE
ncbi:hypothetical protein GLOIN_2v1479874 [Rhizophagus clarus]|nr:hypothetical protein GLOIN_2v1479874 [Rhizophagus clarus]